MATRNVGVIMNGVTGRMGTTQHLERSIAAIRADGGVALADGTRLIPEPILVGRDPDRLASLADRYGLARWTTDLDACLADDSLPIYFDVQRTSSRADAVARALASGKAVYCEKPLASDVSEGRRLVELASEKAVANGVVQDKLFLTGLMKLRRVIASGALGRLLSLRIDFGYWVFEGENEPLQRPSWNYRSEDGGGMVLDMFPHWTYVIEALVGPITRVVCRTKTEIRERFDEHGKRFRVTADDAAYAILDAGDDVVVTVVSSWATRVRRDDLVTFHLDGTNGSAVATLQRCWLQHRATTPRYVWNPDEGEPLDIGPAWQEVPTVSPAKNAFRAQWELFLAHHAVGAPFPWDFAAAVRGLELAAATQQSAVEGRWVEFQPGA